MSPHRGLSNAVVFVFVSCLLCSCGGGGSASQPPPNNGNPVPAIQSVTPSSATAGLNGFTLLIAGSNFLPSSSVAWNGAVRNATLVNSSQLTIAVSSVDLKSSGSVTITVTNPAPGGGQASLTYTIGPPAAPVVAFVSPNTLGAGTAAITLAVTGSNFVANSVAQWNGSARPTTYVSNTQLTVNILASDLTTPLASVPLTVMTPSPGGGNSNSVPVAVVSPALPTITSLSPSPLVLGSGSFYLTVNGTNFVGGATVFWNSISRVTQFVSTTQLIASILASDIALPSANSASITVENPTPNAGISAIATLTLQNPAPTISSISPSSGVAGAPIQVAITGTGFASGATAQLGSQVVPTTYNSPTSLSVTINAAVGSANLTISNPAPSVGPSNVVSFTGTAAGPGVQLTVASVDTSGNTISGADRGMIDASGRFFSFFDLGTNLTTLLCLRDTCLSAPSGCTPTTGQYANCANFPGVAPGSGCSAFWISADGRYVSALADNGSCSHFFQSTYVVDTCLGIASGCTSGTILTTVPNTKGAFMAESGRYISFGTGGCTLPPNPPNTANLYDTCLGAAPGCTQGQIATVTNDPLTVPVPSADGRYLVYENLGSLIILHDSCLSATPGCTPTDQTVSDTTKACQAPTISPDAAYVAWTCSTPNLGNPGPAYLEATCFGLSSGCSTTPSQFAPGAVASGPLAISDGGRFTAFEQPLNSLVEVYLYDSCNGAPPSCTPQTIPVSLNSSGAVANANSTLVSMSKDGKYILFSSVATNLVTLPAGVTGSVSYIALNPIF